MDLGIHVSLWTPQWTSPIPEYIERAAELGFTCVELPAMEPDSFPVKAVAECLQKNNLKVFCGTGLNPSIDISSFETEIRQKGIAHLLSCLEVAAELGSPSLEGVIHSPWGLQEPVSEERRKQAAESLAIIADAAEKRGMYLALECINRYESSFLNTTDQGLDMLNRIDRENVGLHLDTYHMNIEEKSFEEAFRRAGDRLFHLHLSENHRGYPGSGLLPWEGILKELLDIGYNGPLIIESYVRPDYLTGPDVSIWRRIEPDESESLKKAADFIRRLIYENGKLHGGSK